MLKKSLKKSQPEASTKAIGGAQRVEDYSTATEDRRAYVFETIRKAKELTLPAGTYPAVVHSLEVVKLNAGGISIRAELIVALPEDCVRHAVWFRIVESNGRPAEWGPVIFNEMLRSLSYDKEAASDALLEVSREQPAVLIQARAAQKQGYTNVRFLRRIEDNDQIGRCRAWIADHMAATRELRT
jgi:hypothetical protein